jgi:alkanesulfonate monooxygenase SsuD/methylene tetrahydromethanopterin reductase-like flavin-dependent oxidoreductase (luciferase family)
MDVALQLIFQNYGGALPDAEHVAHERRIAELAEPLGFAKVFVVEHHFFDYAACPDNVGLPSPTTMRRSSPRSARPTSRS